jgi:hypothetical protein
MNCPVCWLAAPAQRAWEFDSVRACLIKNSPFLRGQLKEGFGASETLDAPQLDRWPGTDQASPVCRLLYRRLIG